MKKILLLGAVAAMALSASAFTCEHANKVVNGSFEDPNYNWWGWNDSLAAIGADRPNPYNWQEMMNYVDGIPGWGIESNQWIGCMVIMDDEMAAGDGDLRNENDKAFVHFRACDVNGWANMNLYQVVKNLIPGETYNVDYLCAATWQDPNRDPNYGFSVSQVDVNNAGKTIAGMELLNVNLATTDLGIGSDWVPVTGYSFVAPADGQVYFNLYYGNYIGASANISGKWMDIDDVCIWSDNDPAGTDAAVNTVGVDTAKELGVYNLNGVRVANNAAELGNAKGVYVVRTNKGAFKLAR